VRSRQTVSETAVSIVYYLYFTERGRYLPRSDIDTTHSSIISITGFMGRKQAKVSRAAVERYTMCCCESSVRCTENLVRDYVNL
jgi:hypothetical protein